MGLYSWHEWTIWCHKPVGFSWLNSQAWHTLNTNCFALSWAIYQFFTYDSGPHDFTSESPHNWARICKLRHKRHQKGVLNDFLLAVNNSNSIFCARTQAGITERRTWAPITLHRAWTLFAAWPSYEINYEHHDIYMGHEGAGSKISYQNKKSHCGDKVIKLSDLYNGVSFTWYWNIPHMSMSNTSNIKGGKTLLLPFSEHIRENEYGWVYLHCRSVCKAAPLCRWSPVLLLNSVAIYITSVSQSMSLSIRVNFKT